MKTPVLFHTSILALCLLISTLATAQAPLSRPVLPGYWNLETNLSTRDYTIVRFYNGLDQLVYEERLPNLCLNLSDGTGHCRRTSRQLSKALQQVLRTPPVATQATLLALQFNSKRRVQRLYAGR